MDGRDLRAIVIVLAERLSIVLTGKTMAGPSLELFKFSFYVFFPIAMMIHYGDPDWYHRNVYAFRDHFTKPEIEHRRSPQNEDELRERLAQARLERLAKRRDRLADRQQSVGADDRLLRDQEQKVADARRLV
ncbi:uncharacterized protein L969DRAFT_102518 [Mixia osmundae IAM 14324]|uniref:Uncharacterized protein n=1 Tax=Mixia osmundae (strain CBS 9802 / IAM 14324 / JCM 22182 / KY 12970) TaxID=764103 RepID=G7DUF9_MIXOS|nr:uncharacterized protein L969DRAFT_102518 [Mixia osmundae IAM 14324]KEI41092.1 hypothetical protein L969DRAFT_102518 [Mixia osmundae IAM 14324]GAA94219.1 hypothetical protein E5Q_00868 [Mixia osmundae IAM 14324]